MMSPERPCCYCRGRQRPNSVLDCSWPAYANGLFERQTLIRASNWSSSSGIRPELLRFSLASNESVDLGRGGWNPTRPSIKMDWRRRMKRIGHRTPDWKWWERGGWEIGDEIIYLRMIKHSLLDRVTELSDPRSITRVSQFTSSLKASEWWQESVVQFFFL